MIVDTHIHVYDPSRPQGVPWPRPQDEFLYRTVMPEHYKAVAEPEGVTGAVIVEASEWVEDNAWILDVARQDPFILAVVGNLEPGSDEFTHGLERFWPDPLFCGVRLRASTVERMAEPAVAADLEQLAQAGLAIDLLVRPAHLPAVAELARRLPAARLVINHVAGVLIDGNPPDPAWADGMATAAEHANVYCKVSGLASATRQPRAPEHVAFYKPTLDVLWRAFGEDRVFYGSDWPVSARSAEYASVQRVVSEYVRPLGSECAEKYFWRNAAAAYRWPR